MTTHIELRIGRAAAVLMTVAIACASGTAIADDPIRISAEPSVIGLTHWWAEDKGIFKKNRLDYSLTMINAAATGVQAIGAGSNDVVSAAEPPIVINITKGVDAIVIGYVAVGQGVFKLVAPVSVKSVEQLKGKKVTWTGGTGGEYAWVRYLQSKNIPVSAFEFVNLGPAEGVPSLINGSVAAFFGWEPWPRKVMSLKPKEYHVLGSSSDDTYQSAYITVVSRQFARENPEVVKRYLKSLIEASEQINADPAQAAEYYAKRLRVTVPEAREALTDYKLGVQLNANVVKWLSDVSAYLHKAGRIDKELDWRKVVNASYMKAVEPSRVKDF